MVLNIATWADQKTHPQKRLLQCTAVKKQSMHSSKLEMHQNGQNYIKIRNRETIFLGNRETMLLGNSKTMLLCNRETMLLGNRETMLRTLFHSQTIVLHEAKEICIALHRVLRLRLHHNFLTRNKTKQDM